MIYAYIRVSTDHQSIENQRYEISNFCSKNNIAVNYWVTETVSGTKYAENRKLGTLLHKMQKNDLLLCAEISRLGRSLLMIMGILNECMRKSVSVWTIKDNFKLGNDISSKVIAFAFSLSAEIERNLISQRTKEALKRKKSEGVILGRPSVKTGNKRKLSGKEQIIVDLLKQKKTYVSIAKKLGVHRKTVKAFIIDLKLDK